MKRKEFLTFLGIASSAAILQTNAMTENNQKPESYFFKDDGKIPNSIFPLLLYRNAFSERASSGAEWLENHFAKNNWTNSWRNGIYTFHHYHSITHEVLGIYEGEALVHLGGEKGSKINIYAGDIIVIPAGVGHKNLKSSQNFGVVGAYPGGHHFDLLKGEPNDRPKADQNIAHVKFPENDPFLGKNEGLLNIWH